jgi:hypothetical protein
MSASIRWRSAASRYVPRALEQVDSLGPRAVFGELSRLRFDLAEGVVRGRGGVDRCDRRAAGQYDEPSHERDVSRMVLPSALLADALGQ